MSLRAFRNNTHLASLFTGEKGPLRSRTRKVLQNTHKSPQEREENRHSSNDKVKSKNVLVCMQPELLWSLCKLMLLQATSLYSNFSAFPS